jgi:uncharacterized protein YeaO (DUF488 family)
MKAEGREPEVVRLRRVYDEPEDDDGIRVLVDGLWPRGVSKARADLDEWCRSVAPSAELRSWYAHDPARFAEFADRYRRELDDPERASALRHLRDLAAGHRITLLTATKNPQASQAAVLVELLRSS